MKKNSLFAMAALAGALILGSGCSKTGPAGPAGPVGPAGPAMTGNLKGHIFMYDQYGATLLTGLAGTRDSMNGTSNVAICDSMGYYKFSNLSTGDYSFTVAKAGFGTVMAQSVQLAANGDVYRDLKIAQIPNFSVSAVTAALNGVTGAIDFTGTVTADARTRSAMLFIGKTSSTSSAPSTYSNYYGVNIKAGTTTTFTISVFPNDIHDLGVNTGSTLYFAAYGAATTWSTASNYQDYATGHNVFTALSPVPATNSFLMP
jgi:hypothetical protein